MSQAEAVALIYGLARKSLPEPETHAVALRRIVGIVEREFLGNTQAEEKSGRETG